MTKLFTKLGLVAGAIAALPSAAQAGTTTATGTVTFTVSSQCTVTGANISLGTYSTNQTWDDVANALGKLDDNLVYTPGTKGLEYLNFGSVTCDSGTPYTLEILGSDSAIQIVHNGKRSQFVPVLKKIGGVTMPDNDPGLAGAGSIANYSNVASTGTGAPQALVGSAVLYFPMFGSTATPTDTLGVAGVSTDTLTYTLTF